MKLSSSLIRAVVIAASSSHSLILFVCGATLLEHNEHDSSSAEIEATTETSTSTETDTSLIFEVVNEVRSPSIKGVDAPSTTLRSERKEKEGKKGKHSSSDEPVSQRSKNVMISTTPTIMCRDEPDWVVASPENGETSDVALAPFVNMDCNELESIVDEQKGAGHWCNFHRFHTYRGKSAAEACCFCGGGDHKPEPCEDIPNWSLIPSGSSDLISCSFIEILPEATSFCERVGKTKGTDGYTAMEACCACVDSDGKKGGYRPRYGRDGKIPAVDFSKKNRTRKQPSEPTPRVFMPSSTPIRNSSRRYQNQPPFEEDPPEPTPRVVDVRDWTTRTGLGESPGGIPNLEYLGLGYDGLRGNPRGSFSSEIDPGFRSPIFALLQDQAVLSVDQEYTIPLGTSFKYISSCHYDSVSTEISSESDYSSIISGEADMSSASSSSSSTTETSSTSWELGFSAIFPVKGLFGSLGFSYGEATSETESKSEAESQAFRKSERFESFKSTSRTESTVSFEAKAVCSEFEVMFKPYSEQSLDKEFEKALENLPIPYHSKNPQHRRMYAKFIATYGSHYTSKVVLGAKRILTTSMSTQSVAELTKESVDISSALSVKMQEAYSKTSSERWGASAAASLSTSPDAVEAPKFGEDAFSGGRFSGGGGTTYNVIVNDQRGGNVEGKEEGDKKGGGAGASLSGSGENSNESSTSKASSSEYDNFSRNKQQSEAAAKIASKQTKTTEINIGGLPSADWRQWAASVKDKPMPISYELVGLWTLMTDEVAHSFFRAYSDLEGISITTSEADTLLDAMHFGVSGGNGEALSTYTLNPNANYRALLQVNEIADPPTKQDKSPLTVLGENFGTDIITPDSRNQFACGMRVLTQQDFRPHFDYAALIKLQLMFCDIEKWEQQSLEEIKGIKSGRHIDRTTALCGNNYFIDGIRTRSCVPGVRHDRCHDEKHEGLLAIEISCREVGGKNEDRENILVYCFETDLNDCDNDLQWDEWKYIPESKGKNSFVGIYGATATAGFFNDKEKDDKDDVGINGLKLFVREIPLAGTSLENGVVTYAATWKGKEMRTSSAIFATAIYGSVGKVSLDERAIGGINDPNSFSRNRIGKTLFNNIPYAITDNITTPPVLAMSRFSKDTRVPSSFSFFTMEDKLENHKDAVVGIISHTQLVLNDFNNEVNFQTAREKTRIDVRLLGDNRPRNPIVIASTVWYTEGKRIYPSNIADVGVGVLRSTQNNPDEEDSFSVFVGAWREGTNGDALRNTGINFVAVDPNLSNENIVPGFVDVNAAGEITPDPLNATYRVEETLFSDDISTFNIPTVPEFCDLWSSCEEFTLEGRAGSVVIFLRHSFDGLPSVVVTPVFEEESQHPCSLDTNGFNMTKDKIIVPHCVTDWIRKDSFAVKCGCVKKEEGETTLTYYPLPFNFIVVGPAVTN